VPQEDKDGKSIDSDRWGDFCVNWLVFTPHALCY